MSTSSLGSMVTTISKVNDRPQKSQNGEYTDNLREIVYAETTEGQPLVIQCVARGARPLANVTWYYYYKDQQNDDNDYGDGIKNDLNSRTTPADQNPSKSSKHGSPVMLENNQFGGGSTAKSPSDYLISEQRRMEGGAEIIGPVEIVQHSEYEVNKTAIIHISITFYKRLRKI